MDGKRKLLEYRVSAAVTEAKESDSSLVNSGCNVSGRVNLGYGRGHGDMTVCVRGLKFELCFN